jgi:hypothetical protein
MWLLAGIPDSLTSTVFDRLTVRTTCTRADVPTCAERYPSEDTSGLEGVWGPRELGPLFSLFLFGFFFAFVRFLPLGTSALELVECIGSLFLPYRTWNLPRVSVSPEGVSSHLDATFLLPLPHRLTMCLRPLPVVFTVGADTLFSGRLPKHTLISLLRLRGLLYHFDRMFSPCDA